MATSTKKDELQDFSICQDELENPRLLPCIQSFSLDHLERYCRDKQPRDDVPCSACKTEFEIPKSGVAGLTVRTHHTEEHKPAEVCEACSTDELIIPATDYCVDCSQKLCRRCSVPHTKWRGGPHDVRPLDAISSEHRRDGEYCNKHKERLRMYCFDCGTNVCSTCYIEAHQAHKFERTDIDAQEFIRSVDDEIKRVTSYVESFRGVDTQVEAENSKLLRDIQATEQEIKDRGAEAKRCFALLIDGQVSYLLQELQSLKSAAEKEVKSYRDILQLAVTEMESFITSTLELRSKGSPSDITQAASDVRDRAKELLQTWVIPGKYHAPSYKFTPVNIDELLRDDQNFIGHVSRGEVPGTPVL